MLPQCTLARRWAAVCTNFRALALGQAVTGRHLGGGCTWASSSVTQRKTQAPSLRAVSLVNHRIYEMRLKNGMVHCAIEGSSDGAVYVDVRHPTHPVPR